MSETPSSHSRTIKNVWEREVPLSLSTSRIGLKDLEEELRRIVSDTSFAASTASTLGGPTTTQSCSGFRPVVMVGLDIVSSGKTVALGVTWCEIRGEEATFYSELWTQVAPGTFVATSPKK